MLIEHAYSIAVAKISVTLLLPFLLPHHGPQALREPLAMKYFAIVLQQHAHVWPLATKWTLRTEPVTSA